MAKKWHPMNDRKVYRSLQVFHETGQKHSAIILAQKNEHESLQPRYFTFTIFINLKIFKLCFLDRL